MNLQIHQEITHILHNLIRPRYTTNPPSDVAKSRRSRNNNNTTFHGNRAVTHNSINKRTLRLIAERNSTNSDEIEKKRNDSSMKCIATFKNRVPHTPNESNVCARINDTRYTLAAILSAR